MHLLTLGLNHRTAAVDLRERTAFSPEQLPDAVRSLTASSDVVEATIREPLDSWFIPSEFKSEWTLERLQQFYKQVFKFHSIKSTPTHHKQ